VLYVDWNIDDVDWNIDDVDWNIDNVDWNIDDVDWNIDNVDWIWSLKLSWYWILCLLLNICLHEINFINKYPLIKC